MSNSKRSTKGRKAAESSSSGRPEKPFDGFPLYAHPSGNWAKKIRGKFHYFGRWGRIHKGEMVREEEDGWRAALEEYERQAKYRTRVVGPRRFPRMADR